MIYLLNFQQLHSQLRTIYTLILNLEGLQENLYSLAFREHKERNKQSSTKGFSKTIKDDIKIQERKLKFTHNLESIKRQVKQLAHNYSEFVKRYLNLLASSSDMNLQLLSVRLNFNDFYKIS